MRHRSSAIPLVLCGIVLLVLGLAGWASGLDRALHPPFRLAPGGALAHPVVLLSTLGEPRFLVPVALVAALVLLIARRWRDALWLALTIAGGRILVEAVKLLVHRPRPPLADRLETVGSWSFPSAHATNTMMTALAIAIVAGGSPAAIGAALAAAAVIGWTRLALAVHWPGDVVAGWGIGMAWIGAALALRWHLERAGSFRSG